ncbi:MAG: AMP-binding protein [Solirubrobacterales bacterium]
MDSPLGELTKRLPLGPARRLADPVATRVLDIGTLVQAGILRPVRPDKMARLAERWARWGTSPALGSIGTAILYPDEISIIDELGTLTFAETHERSNALARSLLAEGVEPGDGIAIICRNHRGFVEATMACSKLGANALYLNTAFAAPQLKEVVDREEPAAIVYDEEFAGLLEDVGADLRRYIGWKEPDGSADDPTLEEMSASGETGELDPPAKSGRFVILTSGTTGTPKGAQRESPDGIGPLSALLSKIPRRARETTMVAAPLFHSWGFSNFVLGLPLAATMVLRRRFDPEDTLRATAQHRARTLVVVPVMMQRILDLPEDVRSRYDVSSLEITSASGSALPGELATKWMDEFGDNVYNLYGSTEVAWATIATPEDMRAAPGTAGRVPRGTIVKIFGEDGNEVPEGETGRIFVGNDMKFEGYTGGGGKDEIDDLLSSGDVGHFDEQDRLFIDGRDDEMIVSGGENLFPREVEDLLADHGAVAEAAAVGVDDEKFGQRLVAYVVLRDGKDADEDELKRYVKSNLANFKVPREIRFIDELPRNATGKVMKRDLTTDD